MKVLFCIFGLKENWYIHVTGDYIYLNLQNYFKQNLKPPIMKRFKTAVVFPCNLLDTNYVWFCRIYLYFDKDPLFWQMATQNLSGTSHPGTELQYLPYPLQSRHYIPYQPSQVNTQLSAPRSSTQFSRTDPFIHVSSIVVPGIQGTLHPLFHYWAAFIKVLYREFYW